MDRIFQCSVSVAGKRIGDLPAGANYVLVEVVVMVVLADVVVVVDVEL